MQPIEARRLTGPGMLWDRPGAVLDLFGADADFAAGWQVQARRLLEAVGWPDEALIALPFDGGVTLALSAPVDQLYSAVSLAEAAWALCSAGGDFAAIVAALRAEAAAEADPALRGLVAGAEARGIDALWDEDAVSLGHGAGSQVWPVGALPNAVNWDGLHNIPVALITGTNGKTTTTRLCAAIGRAAGLVAGLTSTDMVQVGARVLDKGDFSGPGGARMLLRDPQVQVAFLELARGGILRRGLPVRQARAAAVLNVAADHLGEYGVNTVAALARAKFAVRRGLAAGGIMVLNADDPLVVAEAAGIDGPIWWFSLTPLRRDTPGAWLDGEALVFWDGSALHPVTTVSALPVAMGGAARHNILNALAAICLTRALGIGYDAIRAGLQGFQNSPQDNPGRINEFAVAGARVFVDFAHNPHSIAAVTATLAGVPARRRFVMIAQAGDRSDEDIRGLVAGALALPFDYVVASELAGYLRGRALGVIPDLIAQTCLEMGLSAAQVLRAASPKAGAELVLAMLEPGDLALLLVHSERDAVFAMLEAAQGQSALPTSSKLA